MAYDDDIFGEEYELVDDDSELEEDYADDSEVDSELDSEVEEAPKKPKAEKAEKKKAKRSTKGGGKGKGRTKRAGGSAKSKKPSGEDASAVSEKADAIKTPTRDEKPDQDDKADDAKPAAEEPKGPPADHLVHLYLHGEFHRTLPRQFTDEEAVAFAETYNRSSKPYGRLAVAAADDEKPDATLDN